MIARNLLKQIAKSISRPFSSNYVPPVPPNPTMSESFGTKIHKKDLETLMNPKGFLKEGEEANYSDSTEEEKVVDKINTMTGKESVKEKTYDHLKVSQEQIANENFFDKDKKICEDNGKEEKGFKIKGAEPTRYGDWERNGRCFDF